MVCFRIGWGLGAGHSDYHGRWWLHVGPLLILV